MATIALGQRDIDLVKGEGKNVHSNCCLQPLSQLVLPVEVDFLHNLRIKLGQQQRIQTRVVPKHRLQPKPYCILGSLEHRREDKVTCR